MGLPAKAEVIERENLEFDVIIRDPKAPIFISSNGENNERFQVNQKTEGKFAVKINKAQMSDEGFIEISTPSNRADIQLFSKCSLTVIKGEEAPEFGDCGPVTGIANENCSWNLNYSVEGEQQSALEVIVIKDGQELVIGKDIDITMDDNKIDLSVINPSRDKSGIYSVILRNAQGQVRKDINVNILGMKLFTLL